MRRAVILAAFAGAALVLLAACGDDAGDGAGGRAAATAVEDVDATDLLLAAARRMEQAHSFHFELEHENGTTEIVRGLRLERAEGDIVGTDRLQARLEASIGPLNAEVQIIMIGDDAWITNPLTGRWERERISLDDLFDPATGVTALMRAIADPAVAGTDRIDGVRTYRVEATVDSGDVTLFGAPRAGNTLRATAWIGIDDPLVHRIEVVGAVTAGEPDGLVRRLTLSRFDAEIEIAPPR